MGLIRRLATSLLRGDTSPGSLTVKRKQATWSKPDFRHNSLVCQPLEVRLPCHQPRSFFRDPTPVAA